MQIIPSALKELPDSPSVNFAVANVYGKMDRFIEAEQYFLKAIKLFGARVQAIHYANLGMCECKLRITWHYPLIASFIFFLRY